MPKAVLSKKFEWLYFLLQHLATQRLKMQVNMRGNIAPCWLILELTVENLRVIRIPVP